MRIALVAAVYLSLLQAQPALAADSGDEAAAVTKQPEGGQRADPDFDVTIANPAYTDKHPAVLFDEAHRNFHTATGRY